MEINRAAFGALAVFGIVAAGGGAYLANRHNDAAMQQAPLHPAPAASAVTETENSIATPAVAVEPAPFVAAEPAPAPSRPANVVRRAPAPVRATPPASQRARTAALAPRRVDIVAGVYAIGGACRSAGVGGDRDRWRTRLSSAVPSCRSRRASCTTSW